MTAHAVDRLEALSCIESFVPDVSYIETSHDVAATTTDGLSDGAVLYLVADLSSDCNYVAVANEWRERARQLEEYRVPLSESEEYETVTGLCFLDLPEGLEFVVSDHVDSYAYETMSEYCREHECLVLARWKMN